LERVRAVLQACLDLRCRGSLRERTAGAWFALSGPACVEDTTDLEDAEIYFDYLESREEAGEIADPFAFEKGLSKLYALPDLQADERLEIMTIHKAKGLEFDTVIVPGLGRRSRSDDSKLFLWMEQPREQGNGPADLLLAPIRETGADEDPIYRWLQKLEAEKELLESGRLLYVAATRARQRLHLLGDTRWAADDDGVPALKPPGERTLLGQLWPIIESVYSAAAAAFVPPAQTPAAEDELDQSLRRIASGWQSPPAPPRVEWTPPAEPAHAQDAIEFSWAGETARHIGTVVHCWLQRIADDGLKSWDPARVNALNSVFRDELVASGLPADALGAATGRVAATIAQTLADERGRWLLGPRDDARSELRLTGAGEGGVVNIVMDRTFVDEQGVRWIVDYKTSGHEGGDTEAFLDRERERYRPQLERYAALMKAYDKRPIKLGLYFPLLKGWRELG
jgi:ATP-dependent exoDNAse (exonuclease V) beta subunit